METPPKRVRITKNAVVLTTPEYEETIRARSANQPSSRVRLFHERKNPPNAEQNSERSEVSKSTEAVKRQRKGDLGFSVVIVKCGTRKTVWG